MKVEDLIKKLQQFDLSQKVMILDGSNGSGVPRTINSGPRIQEISASDQNDTDDCDAMIGQSVVCIGFGSY